MVTKTRNLTIGLTTTLMMANKRLTQPILFSQVQRPLPTNLVTPSTEGNKWKCVQCSTRSPACLTHTETPFGGEDSPLLGPDSIGDLQKESYLQQKLKKAVDTIKGNFPKAKFEKIPIRRGKKKRKCGENCCCWAVRKE